MRSSFGSYDLDFHFISFFFGYRRYFQTFYIYVFFFFLSLYVLYSGTLHRQLEVQSEYEFK